METEKNLIEFYHRDGHKESGYIIDHPPEHTYFCVKSECGHITYCNVTEEMIIYNTEG